MKLQPPGAGLPNFERLFIKNILVPSVRIVFTWDVALFFLKREVRIIKKLVNSVESSKLQQNILIERTFAIEDDTRQFSINMVLEHLTIAGKAVKMVVDTLSQEKEFTAEIKIENVKPHENKINQLEEFLDFYNSYFDFIHNLPKTQSKAKKKHPWFIAFNNFDWSVFMYMHTFIHRRQIQAIIKELHNESK